MRSQEAYSNAALIVPSCLDSGEIATYATPDGEKVQMCGGEIITITDSSGQSIEPPKAPRRPKASSVAGNFTRVATHSIFYGQEDARPSASSNE